LVATGLGVWAKVSDSVTDTTLCALYENPAPYAGKFVRVRARVIGHDLRDLWIEDVSACSKPTSYIFMLAELPEHVRPEPRFSLEMNPSLAEFREALPKHVAPSWRRWKAALIRFSSGRRKGT
jgi:hypothetical protein